MELTTMNDDKPADKNAEKIDSDEFEEMLIKYKNRQITDKQAREYFSDSFEKVVQIVVAMRHIDTANTALEQLSEIDFTDNHTPVHPEGTVERSTEPTTQATDEEIEKILDRMSSQREKIRAELEENSRNSTHPHVKIGDKIKTLPTA